MMLIDPMLGFFILIGICLVGCLIAAYLQVREAWRA